MVVELSSSRVMTISRELLASSITRITKVTKLTVLLMFKKEMVDMATVVAMGAGTGDVLYLRAAVAMDVAIRPLQEVVTTRRVGMVVDGQIATNPLPIVTGNVPHAVVILTTVAAIHVTGALHLAAQCLLLMISHLRVQALDMAEVVKIIYPRGVVADMMRMPDTMGIAASMVRGGAAGVRTTAVLTMCPRDPKPSNVDLQGMTPAKTIDNKWKIYF